MRSSLTVLAAGLLALAAAATTGCGLKGDLYLPEDETAAPAPEADETDEEGERRDPPDAAEG
jgi:predicted small lipoprotein YifL